MHLRTIYRDGYTCTVYEPSTRTPNGLDASTLPGGRMMTTDILYDGSEGELYKHDEDPHQWRNLWNDAGYAKIKASLIDDLYTNMPAARAQTLPVEAPA
jgi:hypothetical protein